jgi:DNA-binding GntR family transcriptional regulator
MQIAQEYHKKIYQGLMEMDLEKTIEAIKKHVYYSKRDALKDFLPKS